MLTVDLTRALGPVAPLHGVNLGPLDRRWARNYSDAFRRAAIPSVRLHDASLAQGEVVDLHCVFPDPKADPDDPESYSFRLTDQYLSAIRAAGAEVYFRLGESIEHAPEKIFIRPERWTPDRLARVCANIVRHYNCGWADGHEWGIKRWEFWNEPEGRWHLPPGQRACWTGSADQFVEFYRACAPAVKAADPSALIGLAGFTGGFTRQWLAAAPDDFDGCAGWTGVVARCAHNEVPVDFVSWHQYAESWSGLAEMAAGVRKRLAALGLGAAESHLTEWNYVPVMRDEAGEFTYMNSRMTGNYERYEKAEAVMNGLEGTAFTFGTFALLQDARVDRAHFYTGVSAPWGLFRPSGRPTIKLAAFEAFAEFLGDDAQRLAVGGEDEAGVRALAVRRGGGLQLGVAHLAAAPAGIDVRITGLSEGARVTAVRHLEDDGWAPGGAELHGNVVRVEAASPGVSLIEFAD